MGKREKRQKIKEPKKQKSVYIEIPGLAGNVLDYHVYHMNGKEKRTGALMGAALGFVVIYIFFTNPVAALLCAIATSQFGIKVYKGNLQEKRKRMLAIEFRDMLEAVSTSLGAGKNVVDSFSEAYGDMVGQYGEDSYICRELEAILIGVNNNIKIEDMLMNFSMRSGNEDIQSFADVFVAANRAGGNIREIIFETKNVISDKMAIEQEIETLVSGKKNELNIMIVLPFIVVMQLRGLNATGGSLKSILIDIGIKIVVLCMFAGAYVLGQKMVKIKV